tara:strand:- start:509 stop:1003 length:495 start_codon:yes stop_codon:yes gene_type:complete
MTLRTDKEVELAGIFKELGARHPESWAQSEIHEGIPQLLRYVFLREAWRRVVPDDDSWMERAIASDERWPDGGLAYGLRRCIEAGVDRATLNDMIRNVQAEMIFSIGYLMDGGPQSDEGPLAHMYWNLFETDEDGNPLRVIGGLHESVAETDPTGREMRPKGRT